MNTNGTTQAVKEESATSLEIHAQGVHVVPAFREYIDEKITELEMHWPRIDSAHVHLQEEHGTFASEVTVFSGGLVTRGEERADEARIAFDAAYTKLEKQLRRYQQKSMARARRHDNRDGLEVKRAEPQAQNGEAVRHDDAEDKRMRTKRFAVKPMSPDEAALQMDLLGHAFFVFRDADTNDVGVVYKRRGGGYGLIETTSA